MEKVTSYVIPEKPHSYLLESWLVFLVLAFPFGLIPLIFSIRVSKKYNKGDYGAAIKASNRARLWNIICLIYGIITTIIFIISLIIGWS